MARTEIYGFVMAASLAASSAWASAPAPKVVAGFDQQVTGVAVSKDGRIFVNFPRWEKDVPISVAEVMKDGTPEAVSGCRLERLEQPQAAVAGRPFRLRAERHGRSAGLPVGGRPGGARQRVHQARRRQAGEDRPPDQQGGAGVPVRRDRGAAGQLHERRARQPGRQLRLPDRLRAARRAGRGGRATGQAPGAGRRPAHPAGARRGAACGRPRAAPAGPPHPVLRRRRHRARSGRQLSLLAGAGRAHAVPRPDRLADSATMSPADVGRQRREARHHQRRRRLLDGRAGLPVHHRPGGQRGAHARAGRHA